MSRRRSQPRCTLPAAVLALALAAAPMLPLRADPDRPDPPQSRVRIYDADALTCRPERLEAGFRSHMAPWADQPQEVQQRLRLLQGEMTRNSVQRCLSKGLLTADEATDLERRLGLTPAATPGAVQPASPSTTRP